MPDGFILITGLDGIRYAVQYGGEAGKLISAEKPGESLLLQVVEYAGRLKMPPSGKLKDEQIEDLRLWVEAGAPVPGGNGSSTSARAATTATAGKSSPPVAVRKREFTDAQKNFWAFQKFSGGQTYYFCSRTCAHKFQEQLAG